MITTILSVGAVVFYNNKILLVKRRNPPNQNQWAIPGGKVHQNESLEQAASRELQEETGITVNVLEPFYSFDEIHETAKNEYIHYIILDFICEYVSGSVHAASDAKEARWINRTELNNINLNKTTKYVLMHYFNFK